METTDYIPYSLIDSISSTYSIEYDTCITIQLKDGTTWYCGLSMTVDANGLHGKFTTQHS